MPSKKSTSILVKSSFTDEVKQIKSRQIKSNLYLSILEQELVQLTDLPDSEEVGEISLEIKEFILQKLKEIQGALAEPSASFSEVEIKTLKFIADKFITGAPVSVPKKAAPVEDEEDEYEEDEEEEIEEEEEEVVVKKKGRKPVAKPKVKVKVKKSSKQKFIDSHLIKTPVKIKQADGTTIDGISVTQKIVAPPNNVRRIPAPTFEQEYLAARAATAGFEKQAAQLQAIPLMGGSSDSSED
jgi:hypothetical protein